MAKYLIEENVLLGLIEDSLKHSAVVYNTYYDPEAAQLVANAERDYLEEYAQACHVDEDKVSYRMIAKTHLLHYKKFVWEESEDVKDED